MVSIICLVIFIVFLEIRLKRELLEVKKNFKIVEDEILKNREKIQENKNIISKINE